MKATNPYLCDYFLLVTKTFNSLGAKKEKKTKTKEGEEEFYKEEERIYKKHSEFHVSFPVDFLDQASRWTFQSDIVQHKLILIFKAEKIPLILKEIEEYIKIN